MNVHVDSLRPCATRPFWPYNQSCHLYATPLHAEDVHALAAKIGLKREWFQPKAVIPHYDLTPGKRVEAVAAGTIEVNDRTLVRHMRLWRNWRLIQPKKVVAPAGG
jgi:hypothetical protein